MQVKSIYMESKTTNIGEGFNLCHGLSLFKVPYMSYGSYAIPDNVKNDDDDWLAESAISTALNINSMSYMNVHFSKEVVLSIKAIPLGRKTVLLNFDSQEVMESFLSNDAE